MACRLRPLAAQRWQTAASNHKRCQTSASGVYPLFASSLFCREFASVLQDASCGEARERSAIAGPRDQLSWSTLLAEAISHPPPAGSARRAATRAINKSCSLQPSARSQTQAQRARCPTTEEAVKTPRRATPARLETRRRRPATSNTTTTSRRSTIRHSRKCPTVQPAPDAARPGDGTERPTTPDGTWVDYKGEPLRQNFDASGWFDCDPKSSKWS